MEPIFNSLLDCIEVCLLVWYSPATMTALGAWSIWRAATAVLLLLVATFGPLPRLVLPSSPQPAESQGNSRKVNVRPASAPVADFWNQSSIFWFGRATETDNYIDVRVTYDEQALYFDARIADYFLWCDSDGATDPRLHDAVAFYLDAGSPGGPAPQADDYFFVSGYVFWPSGNDAWHRQGRGNGGTWDESWLPLPEWTDTTTARFYNSGPNDNSDRDAGWTTTVKIPWSTLGSSGPPPPGTTWGLGAVLYDQDEPSPASPAAAKAWPEGMLASSPSTWGAIVFDPPAYEPPPAVVEGTTTIRRGLNGSVSDAYAGGGGLCGGGIFGGGDVPHPADDLFVQNQSDIADFPCFSKSYLRFDLSSVPRGKVILSATLRLYQFGGSDPSQAYGSLIQVFSLTDDWSEDTLTWNNAPLAAQNYAGTWVYPIQQFPGWPGVPVTWDVTELVANSYAAGRPANLALYSADMAYHSGKYFVSSETGDWNAEGRPSLTVTWGRSFPSLSKQASRSSARLGDALTYTLTVGGTGRPLELVDALPAEVAYISGSATGGAIYSSTTNTVRWTGAPAVGEAAAITYRVRINTTMAKAVRNAATLTDEALPSVTASAVVIANGYGLYLPILRVQDPG